MTSATSESAFNARVGSNLKRLRKAHGLSQTELAERLTAQGVPCSQQMLVKIETGKRPLRLREADAVAAVLDVLNWELLAEPEPPAGTSSKIDLVAALVPGERRVRTAEAAVVAAVIDLLQQQRFLRQTVSDFQRDGVLPLDLEDPAWASVEGAYDGALAALEVTPAGAAAVGVTRYRGEREEWRAAKYELTPDINTELD